MEARNSVPDIDVVLLEVRKAYRLLYTYQRRVMDIMEFVADQTSRRYAGGWSKFSASSPKDGKGSLDQTWAWDWLNMYCYEFWFGEKIIDGNNISFSVWLVSDTGFYDTASEDALDISKFNVVEDSITKLVFVVGRNTWHSGFETFESILKKNMEKYINTDEKGCLLAKSFNLSFFTNFDHSRACLKEFIIFCHKNGIPEISILPD
ncbi:MAG: hypothetical protein JWQ40_5050 [Segetibacter sp.]|nr:hypothetical protein [Segetibacter sp.]